MSSFISFRQRDHCSNVTHFAAGFTTYKLTFHLTEETHQSYLNAAYSEYTYTGYYSMCTPYVQSVNDVLRDRVGH